MQYNTIMQWKKIHDNLKIYKKQLYFVKLIRQAIWRWNSTKLLHQHLTEKSDWIMIDDKTYIKIKLLTLPNWFQIQN